MGVSPTRPSSSVRNSMAQELAIRFATNTSEARNAIATLASSVTSSAVQMATSVGTAVQAVNAVSTGLSTASAVAKQALPALVAIGGAIAVFQAIGAAVDAAKESV